MVRGRARHSPSNGGIERMNREMETKLAHWMRNNPTSRPGAPGWATGCYIVRWQILTAFSSAIGKVPYQSLFGHLPRCGISSLALSDDLINSLRTEAELHVALGVGGGSSPDSVLSIPVMKQVCFMTSLHA